MPGGAATKALVNAAPKTSGTLRAGILNSLSYRDCECVPGVLQDYVNDPDPNVAEAATTGLARVQAK